MVASIIICTCNRAAYLRQTLSSLASVGVPEHMPTELIVVDNASTDDTSDVVRNCSLPNMPVRYLLEPCRGKSHGLNTALTEAKGDILIFTDDDIRFPHDWLIRLCEPLLAGKADAVQGGIRLAPHLQRPWMTTLHHAQLASTEHCFEYDGLDLIGANMAVSRRVFEKVPGFDTEIGPGPAAGGEDTLFSWQIEQAGYRIYHALDVIVEHHLDPARLLRNKLLRGIRLGSISDAYLAHHWDHKIITWPHLRLLRAWLRLSFWRVKRWREWHREEGAAVWEMGMVKDLFFYRNYLGERRRPRNYVRHGLVKIQQGIEK